MGRNYLSPSTSSVILDMLGFDDTKTNLEQFDILVWAMEKFVERNAKYKDLWQTYGAEDNVLHITSKASRLKRLMEVDGLAMDLDDAVDLINYTVFFIRNMERDKVYADQEAEGT